MPEDFFLIQSYLMSLALVGFRGLFYYQLASLIILQLIPFIFNIFLFKYSLLKNKFEGIVDTSLRIIYLFSYLILLGKFDLLIQWPFSVVLILISVVALVKMLFQFFGKFIKKKIKEVENITIKPKKIIRKKKKRFGRGTGRAPQARLRNNFPRSKKNLEN